RRIDQLQRTFPAPLPFVFPNHELKDRLPILNFRSCGWLRAALSVRHDQDVSGVATDCAGHHDTATCSMFIGGLDNDPPVGLKVSNGFGLRERNHDLKAPGV